MLLTLFHFLTLSTATPVPETHVFVINLAHRTDRMKLFDDQAVRDGVPYLRVDASTPADARRALDAGEVVLNSTFRDPDTGRRMKLGEVACAMSHFRAWEAVASLDPGEYGVVFEDDAVFDRYAERIDAVAKGAAAHGAEFVYLSHREHAGAKRVPVDELFKTCAWNYWANAYMLSSDGARRLVAQELEYKHNLIPSDEYLPIVLGTLDGPPSSADEPVRMSCEPETGCRGAHDEDPRYPNTRLRCLTVAEKLALSRDDKAFVSDTEWSEVVSEDHQAPDSRVVVATVATDTSHAGFETLRRSVEYFGYRFVVLGDGDEWIGGDVVRTTGGGMKLSLMKEFLDTVDENLLVVFTDGYDTVFQLGPDALVERFEKFKVDVVISAETQCWPDKRLCDRYARILSDAGQFRYVNSGNYMGLAKHLKTLLRDFDPDQPDSDDQLYISQRYLDSLVHAKRKLALDNGCVLFQPLSGVENGDWTMRGHVFHNELTNSDPVVLHGNGISKRTLVGISNYVAGGFDDFYGSKQNIRVDPESIRTYPLCLGLFFIGTPFEGDFLESVMALKLDRKKTRLYIHHAAGSRIALDHELRQTFRSCATIQPTTDCSARAKFFASADTDGCAYALAVDSEVILERRTILSDLVEWNKSIAFGHAKRETTVWSNFWSDMRPDGWYRRGFDTLALYNRERKGLWRVPYAHGLMLVRRDALAKLSAAYAKTPAENDDCQRVACIEALNAGIGFHVDNRELYGTLLGDSVFARPDAPFPELYEANKSPSLWAKHYLVPDHATVALEQPCQDVYGGLFFTERFCRELIATTEAADQWSSGNHADERVGGYENVPTRDIHMNQFGWEEAWVFVLERFVAPRVRETYDGFNFQGQINLAFVVKYSMEGQTALRPHNDYSDVTTTVVLNGNFTGGGVMFTRYNCSYVSKEAGYLMFHPGRVTHNHMAYPITSGVRYMLVSFNK